jgi:hypothetical protein
VDKSQLFECKMYMAVVKCHIKWDLFPTRN